jgi:hypothetical protein
MAARACLLLLLAVGLAHAESTVHGWHGMEASVEGARAHAASLDISEVRFVVAVVRSRGAYAVRWYRGHDVGAVVHGFVVAPTDADDTNTHHHAPIARMHGAIIYVARSHVGAAPPLQFPLRSHLLS